MVFLFEQTRKYRSKINSFCFAFAFCKLLSITVSKTCQFLVLRFRLFNGVEEKSWRFAFKMKLTNSAPEKERERESVKPTKFGTKTIYLPFHTWNVCQNLFASIFGVVVYTVRFEKMWFYSMFSMLHCNVVLLQFPTISVFCLFLCYLFKTNIPLQRSKPLFFHSEFVQHHERDQNVCLYILALYFGHAIPYFILPQQREIGHFFLGQQFIFL